MPKDNINPINDTCCKHKLVYDESKVPIFRNQLIDSQSVLDQLTESVNTEQIDSIVQSFTNCIFEKTANVFSKNVFDRTNRMYSTNKNIWFDENCTEAKNDFKQARNRFLKNKNVINRQNFILARTKYNRVKRLAKKRYKIKEGKEVCDMARKQPKQFWKSIKKKFKSKTLQSEKLTATDLYEHFKSIFGDDQAPLHQEGQDTTSETIYNAELDSDITENEIKNAVFSQKNNKSSGNDQLCVELFKASFDIISPFLLKLYNRLFINGEYPHLWGEGIIVPIFKGGSRKLQGDYTYKCFGENLLANFVK